MLTYIGYVNNLQPWWFVNVDLIAFAMALAIFAK